MHLKDRFERNCRRILAPSFSESALRKQEQFLSAYVDLLIRRLHDNAGKPIDIWKWTKFFAFDIVGDLTFGESFDCLESSKEHVRYFLQTSSTGHRR